MLLSITQILQLPSRTILGFSLVLYGVHFNCTPTSMVKKQSPSLGVRIQNSNCTEQGHSKQCYTLYWHPRVPWHTESIGSTECEYPRGKQRSFQGCENSARMKAPPWHYSDLIALENLNYYKLHSSREPAISSGPGDKMCSASHRMGIRKTKGRAGQARSESPGSLRSPGRPCCRYRS